MRKLVCLFIVISLLACSKTTDPLRKDNSITLFQIKIDGEVVAGKINQANNSITFDLVDADITALRPSITVSEGATINPPIYSPQNFSQEVKYNVTAEDGSLRRYTVLVHNKISSGENLITLFQLPINGENVSGEIDQTNNTISFNIVGAELESLSPTIDISEKATLNPLPSTSLNFNEEVSYTVTAENGDERSYTIIVNNRILSAESEILSFIVELNGENVEARLDQDLKEIAFETGSLNISRLVPGIMISENATIYPAFGEPVDFKVPVTYTVTAENGDSSQYTVAINKAFTIQASTPLGPRTGGQKLYTGAKLNVSTSFLDPSLPGVEIYLFDGTNRISLPILEVTTGYESRRKIYYSIETIIPENTVTSTNYSIGYKLGDFVFESNNPDSNIDVLAENAPKITGINQDLYFIGDTLIVTGENLTPLIGVPSNGSFYLFNPLGHIDTELNPEKTEYKVLLDGSFSRSAFFQYQGSTRDVIFVGPSNRIGHQITVNVNR